MNSFFIGEKNQGGFSIGNINDKISFILGPCAIENKDHSFKMADLISNICVKLNINWVFKSCYDKDCRSSINSFHGIGIDEGLKILDEIKSNFKIPVISDFSRYDEAQSVGSVCDILQVPAYLCRQTSVLEAASKTNKVVLIKKGQFMSPWNMKNSVKKIEHFGNDKIILADRGTFFGYNMLINDMRAIKIMSDIGYPVCYDGTHSIQMPTSMGNISGGQREFIPGLVRSSVAMGAQMIFLEVHDNPSKALSDSNTVLNIKYLENILKQTIIIKNALNEIKIQNLEDEVE